MFEQLLYAIVRIRTCTFKWCSNINLYFRQFYIHKLFIFYEEFNQRSELIALTFHFLFLLKMQDSMYNFVRLAAASEHRTRNHKITKRESSAFPSHQLRSGSIFYCNCGHVADCNCGHVLVA